MSKFDDFVTASTAANGALSAALDNIVADEANVLQQLQDLKNQVGQGTGTLTPAQEASLDAAITQLNASVTKAQSIASSIPDLPPPPPPPGS